MISQEVYYIDSLFAPPFTPFGDSRMVVSDPPGGEGGIVNGLLNFSFGRPAAEHLQSVAHMFEDWVGFDDVRVAPAAARGANLQLLTMTGTNINGDIFRLHMTGTTTSATQRSVTYIYVDRDVTISSRGITYQYPCGCEEWDGECMCAEWDGACSCYETFTIRPFSITLREGWNALHGRTEFRLGATDITITLSHENPGSPLRWWLQEWGGWPEDTELSGRAPCCRTDARPSFRTRR